MSDYVEAVVTLVPQTAGGRADPIHPRDGSYRPFARGVGERALLRIRFIEGPPLLMPGDTGRVVFEVEADSFPGVSPGTELDLVELDSRLVGLVTVARVWREHSLIA